jgi:Peptidase inhibitor I78 family
MRLLLLILLSTSACATPQHIPPYSKDKVSVDKAGGFECDAKSVAYAIGQKATPEVAAKLMKEAGGEILRWIPPRTAVTMDYSAMRLNIVYDDAYIITDINCG